MSQATGDAVPAAVLDIAAAWALAPRFDLVTTVGRHIGLALARLSRPATVACHDNWSARIALDAVALSPIQGVSVCVVETTDELRTRAERRHVVLCEEPGIAPAVVIAPRLGCDTGDIGNRITALCAGCADDATVVWSHCLLTTDRATAVRAAFAGADFIEVATETVGTHPLFPGWLVSSHIRGPVPPRQGRP